MSENQLAVRPKASQQLAQFIGMEPGAMLDVIKAQCFKGNPANVTNEQLAAFVSIAAEMQLNPLLPGFLYAYPIQGGGIVPIIGPDGIYKRLSEHAEVDSWETEVFPADVSVPPTHAVTKIWRKGRERPLQYTALLSEWKIGSNPNWNTRPRHMLALRSLKHAARQIIHGIPGDEDDRIIMGEIDVTPKGDGQAGQTPPPDRPAPPPRKPKGASAVTQPAAIDVETVDPKPQETAQGGNITQFPAQTPPQKPAEKVAEKVAEPVLTSKADVHRTEPRTSLKDGEEATFLVKVGKVYAMNVTKEGAPCATVNAAVDGEFVGNVYHFGGASLVDGNLVAGTTWKEGAQLTLTLFGRINKKSGNVLTEVKKIVPAEGQSDTAAVDV